MKKKANIIIDGITNVLLESLGNEDYYIKKGIVQYVSLCDEFSEFITNLDMRYQDEYEYEDLKDYHKVIEKFLCKRFPNTRIVDISNYDYRATYIEKSRLSFAIPYKVGKGICVYFSDTSDMFDCDIANELPKYDEPLKITDKEYLVRHGKSQIGEKIKLNGLDYKIGDVCISYSDFEGGYISIGQIVRWDLENNKYEIILSNDNIDSLDEWNRAVSTKSVFIMANNIEMVCYNGKINRADEKYYPFSKERLKEFQAKLRNGK